MDRISMSLYDVLVIVNYLDGYMTKVGSSTAEFNKVLKKYNLTVKDAYRIYKAVRCGNYRLL